MTQLFHCEECNIDIDHHSLPGCANKSQAIAGGLEITISLSCPKCKKGMTEKAPASLQSARYTCPACERKIDLVLPKRDITDTRLCTCGTYMNHEWWAAGAPAVSRSGSSKATIDQVVGRNAEKRWETIHDRQDKRNRIRRDAGQQGLVATSPTTFAPISMAQRELRTRVMDTASKKGVGTENSASERTLLGT